jgi:hypothetical protein
MLTFNKMRDVRGQAQSSAARHQQTCDALFVSQLLPLANLLVDLGCDRRPFLGSPDLC